MEKDCLFCKYDNSPLAVEAWQEPCYSCENHSCFSDIFKVYEIFPDDHKIIRFESDSYFECEVYIFHHKYDNTRSKSILKIM